MVKNGTSVLQGMDIWDTPSRDVEWAVKDMIPMRKKTVAVGDFEAGKSYLYLGAALSIAGGRLGISDLRYQRCVKCCMWI